MSHWNYRVVQSYDRKEFFIAEVYYDDNGYTGWLAADDRLKWEDYDDLKGTVEKIGEAFDRPLLQVGEGDHLVEVTPNPT
jgi:hypothetical protein